MKIFLFGILAVVLLGVAGFILSLAKEKNEPSKEQSNNQPTQREQSMTPHEFEIEDLIVGEGTEAAAGKLITVHYTGTLINGTKFDSSVDRGTPFEFVLGAGRVIQGWEQGILGMKVGGKRKLTIPPDLAYGAASGHQLQNQTLLFEVDLLDVTDQ
jgi:FKBP-type peptidyl-prolyl cis-trans isomerase